MDITHIPGPYDATMLLEDVAGITKTADYDGTGKDLGSGYAPGSIGQPAAAVVQVSDLDLVNTDETYTFVVEESDDDSTYTAAGPIISVTATGALSVPCFLSKQYCRVKLDVAGTTPSITYKAHLVPLGFIG